MKKTGNSQSGASERRQREIEDILLRRDWTDSVERAVDNVKHIPHYKGHRDVKLNTQRYTQMLENKSFTTKNTGMLKMQ